MKKITIIVLFAFIILPQSALAAFYLPSFTLKIIKNTEAGDGTFTFGAYGRNSLGFNLNPYIQKQISTVSGQASMKFGLDPNDYQVHEESQSGWQLSNVSCTSSSPLTSFISIGDGVEIDNTLDGEQITCTFTNAQVSEEKPPVLIIPGIMGTEIFKGADELWANVTKMLYTKGDSFMDPLSFYADGSPSDTSLSTREVISNKALAGIELINYSQKLISDLQTKNYTKGTNLFLFPYDWRRDIQDIAVTDDSQMKNPSLEQIINQILSSTGASKIDIIAHSQGGLVIKRLLEEKPEYESKINKLVFVGVPNLGAPKAAKALLYGDSMGVEFAGLGLDSKELKKISQNMPAVYELLPSSEYFNHTNGYLGTAQVVSSDPPILHVTTLNSGDTSQYLKGQNLNGNLIDKAQSFHSSNYDNFDFIRSGIKAYNIVGCQAGTLGKILAKPDGSFQVVSAPGDGTVPVFSANNMKGATTYFALESSHGTMLTQDGIRQQIINLITGDTASTQGKITQNISDCHFNGREVSSHSPVDLHIYDSLGRHIGPTADGGFDSEIPNVGYETIGHENFAFLPVGEQYAVKLVATGTGNFSFDSSVIQEGQTANTAHYDSVAITASSTAQINLNPDNNQIIELDKNGDGVVDAAIAPSSILNAEQSQDLTPSVSTSTISGTMGESGFYRSDVKINLSAVDPIVDNNASTTSGVLNIKYSMDNTATTTYLAPVSVTSEGLHTITFFSTDRAGNNEAIKTINFTIDKTAPEAVIQFNPALKDIGFIGTDNISTTSKVTVLDNVNDILLTDQAGNVTDIKLKEKDRKKSMSSTIQSLSYNQTQQDVSKNILAFLWTYDKNNNLISLSQNVAAKKTYLILAVYNGKKTSLVGIDKTGIILKSINGLSLLKVSTSKGDLSWGY